MGSQQVTDSEPIGVLFVCLGNICRSPLAEALLRYRLQAKELQELVRVDSCGTAAFNVGKPPDPRAVNAAAKMGLDISEQRARQINEDDYSDMDYIIAMDQINLINVRTWAPESFAGEMSVLMQYSKPSGNSQVADPFYEKEDKFDELIMALDKGVSALLEHIVKTHNLTLTDREKAL